MTVARAVSRGGLLEASLAEVVSRQTGRRESDSECPQQLLLREDATKEFVIRFKIVNRRYDLPAWPGSGTILHTRYI